MYFEALGWNINCNESRFDQPGFCIYQSIESLLVKACKKDVNEVCETYKYDFDKDLLCTQL